MDLACLLLSCWEGTKGVAVLAYAVRVAAEAVALFSSLSNMQVLHIKILTDVWILVAKPSLVEMEFHVR